MKPFLPGLRAVLFAVFTTLAIGPVLLLGFGVYKPALEREIESVQEKHLLIARSLAAALSQYAAEVSSAFLLATSHLNAGAPPDRDLLSLLRAKRFGDVCRFEVSGTRVCLMGSTAAELDSVAAQIRLDPMLGTASAGMRFSAALPGPDGSPVLYLSLPGPSGTRYLGWVDTSYIRGLQSTVVFGEKGHAAIVDHTGRALAHPRAEWAESSRDLSSVEPVRRMLLGEEGVTFFFSPAINMEMVTGFASVGNVGWGVMVPQPLSELEQNAKALSRATFRTAIVALLIAAVLSWWLAGRLVQPLHNVVTAARRSTGGHDPVRARSPGLVPREFHELTSNFNAMVEEVRTSRAALEASGRRLWDFADGAADWFWECDAEMRLRFLSDRFAVVTGMAAEQSLGQDLAALIRDSLMDPEEWDSVSVQLQRHEPFSGVRLAWPVPGPRTHQIYRMSGKPVLDDHGVFQGYRGTGRDVTDEERLARQLAHQAAHDDLTGLVNRREFEIRLAHAMESARSAKSLHVLCYLDLDQFKRVNDSAGHAAGDALLSGLAAMLRKRIRGRDTLARLGGDEFGLLLEHCDMAKAEQIVGVLVRAVHDFSFDWEGCEFSVGASAGLVPIDDSIADVSDALRRADAACYVAKAQGGGRISTDAI